jgi:hypothetical protein
MGPDNSFRPKPVSRAGLIQALDLMGDNLGDLQKRYEHLLQKLSPLVPASVFHQHIQTRPTNNGDAHVEVVGGMLHYVITERGTELRRRIASDSEELLYWLIDDVTSSISYKFNAPLLHRLLRKDPRHQRFKKHLELLERVNPAWAERKKIYYAEVLGRYPYMDKA